MHARVLRYFDEVVRHGSIRKAAGYLHVAPTAVSRQILDLEADLGAPLFERINRRLRLTPLGEMVLAHVRETLKAHDALREQVEAFRTARQGVVTVAATAGLAGALLPALLHGFRTRYPGVVVRVPDLPVADIAEAVRQGDADLGLGYDFPDDAALMVQAASEWRVGAVVAPAHPLAARKSVELADCAGFPLLLPDASLSLRGLLDRAFAHASIAAPAAIETTSTALMRRLAVLGTGVALLNPLDVVDELAAGSLRFVPVRDPGLPAQSLRLVSRARAALSPVAALMRDAIRDVLADLYAGPAPR